MHVGSKAKSSSVSHRYFLTAIVRITAAARPEPLAKVAGEIELLSRRVIAIPTGVTVRADLERLAEQTVAAFGPVTIEVNNAGGLQGEPMGVLITVTEESWHNIFARNLTAVWAASNVAQGALADGCVITSPAASCT